MSRKSSEKLGCMVHLCPLSVRGGGEKNVQGILEATRSDVDWRVLGVDEGYQYRDLFIPEGIAFEHLGWRGRILTPINDVIKIRAATTSDGEVPILYTSPGRRVLTTMPILRAYGHEAQYFLWQNAPRRPDITDNKLRRKVETTNGLTGRIALHHLTFSPVCVDQLRAMGVGEKRIRLLPQLLDSRCDRDIRRQKDMLGIKRDTVNDALRILIISRVSREKGIDKLPEFLEVLEPQLEERGVKMAVTLMGSASSGQESEEMVRDLNEVSARLKNVRFDFTGYRQPEEVYGRMANSDIALSLSETECYSVAVIEGMNMGLPQAVQPICAPNVDVVKRSGAGWVLSGKIKEDATRIARWRFDDPDILDGRQKGYQFVDATAGTARFRDEFMAEVFERRR